MNWRLCDALCLEPCESLGEELECLLGKKVRFDRTSYTDSIVDVGDVHITFGC